MTKSQQNPAWPAMTIAQAHALMTAPGSPLEMRRSDIRGIQTKVWKNCPRPCARSCFTPARITAAREFLVYEDDRATYEELLSRRGRASRSELQKQGVKKGDRVALIMRNLPEWPVAFFGAAIDRRDRHAAERLVDGAGAGIRPGRFRRQGRLRRCRAAGAHRRASRQLPGPQARLCQPLPGRARRIRSSRGWRTSSAPVNDWGKLPDRPLPDVPLGRRTTTPPSSTPPAPPESRRARSAPTATCSRTSRRRHARQRATSCGAASRRRCPTPTTAAARDAAVGAVLPRHRLLRGAEPDPVRRRQDRADAQLGRRAGACS